MDVDEKSVVPKIWFYCSTEALDDLKSTVLSQAGQSMSNKKCKLLDGLFKRTQKGYEEVHVPALKQKLLSIARTYLLA